MNPELSHAMAHHVRFPTKASYFHYKVALSGPSSSPERSPPPTLVPHRFRAGSVDEMSVWCGHEAADDIADVGLDPTSTRTQMRGKEGEEKAAYGDKIKKLEEEVKRLRLGGESLDVHTNERAIVAEPVRGRRSISAGGALICASTGMPGAAPLKGSRSYIPVRVRPSSSVNGTNVTPSLTSHGDVKQGPDEPLPPTPPQVPTVVVASPKEEEVLPPSPPPKKGTSVSCPPTPPRRAQACGQLAHIVFNKHLPRSPLSVPTPLKARPDVIRCAADEARRIR
ncbi:hypothetical protein BJV78DRAFT_1284223 [Lactifluus subvellereus]|nr:hypothetical protein BJV78DRAFT_1284223 [Lactifluus subvellereus]